MPKTKVEVYDKDQLIYPFIESDHVTFSNGMKITEMLDQSISMPKVTHEDSSFKVGVGDQDVSSAIVDSSVAEMTIKGQTYQNILPEPSLRNKMIGKSMQRLNEGYDNIEVVDGVSKSAILKGCTLVNLIKDSTEGELSLTEGHKDLKLLYTLKNLTQYTLLMNVISANDNNTSNWWCGIMKTGDWGSESKQYVKGINKLLFTTKEESDCYAVRIRGLGTTIKNVMLLEGDYTNVDIPYFEGMQSVKMPVLTTTGKNLFDFEKTQSGYLGSNPHVLFAPDLSNRTSDYIRVKPNTTYTYSFDGFTASQVGGAHWTGWYYYTSPTEVSKKDMNRHVASGSADTFKTVTFTTPSDCYYVRIGSRGLALSGAVVQLEESSIATSYEPYKSSILSTPSDLILRGIGDVRDELNCLTGELTERISTFKPTGAWSVSREMTNTILFTVKPPIDMDLSAFITCDNLPVVSPDGGGLWDTDIEGIGRVARGDLIRIRLAKTKASTLQEFVNYMQSNPITIQYQLVTESIKTVDLSSSGNWEKVVLDGSEDVVKHLSGNFAYYTYGSSSITNVLPYASGGRAFASHTLTGSTGASNLVTNYKYIVSPKTTGTTGLCFSLDGSMTVEEAKTFLSQNPITVWYQTTNHKDSTQVKQPIFFKDGHIQLSSGADNSLIPTLDYQAKTSNSYVMDLMKTNTKYTMKAKSANGTFTIDGTSYGAGTNGIFTTPTLMTNKLLVMSNKTNEEVMIIEGDVVSKTIPYFKGIKSAFEDEDKIEVLSTGKNLFDYSIDNIYTTSSRTEYAPTLNEDGSITVNSCYDNPYWLKRGFYVEEGKKYTVTVKGMKSGGYSSLCFGFDNLKYLDGGAGKVLIPANTMGNCIDTVDVYGTKSMTCTALETGYITRFYIHGSDNTPRYTILDFQIEESSISTTYEPHKSNNTKIPLLHPLRSLPNGVCDEIILDRENNKAKIIQRVGKVILDGSENWGYTPDWVKGKTIGFYLLNDKSNGFCLSDKFIFYHGINSVDHECVSFPKNAWLGVRIKVDKLGTQDVDGFKQYLQQNPLTVYYDLATPIVTEIDLEGFPYIYKDGHIFLNSEIVPTTEIIYSINQSQQISASNEDIIRHEKELTYLQKLIAQYVQVDYESVLLSLKV